MTSNKVLPACLVVGRNDHSFHLCGRKLGSKANFVRSNEIEASSEITRLNVDVVVVLWSHTSRQCAQTLHRQFPKLKIVLEQNRSSLSGIGEKNGFLSVIERSQDRTELLMQVEAALEDCRGEGKLLAPEEFVFDSRSVVDRLAAVPLNGSGLHRTADYLVDLFLSAMKSGTGALFLAGDENGDYTLWSSRNLPYQANSVRISSSSKIAGLIANQQQPIQCSHEDKESPLRLMAERFGCDLVLPLRVNGSLKGWFMLFLGQALTRMDKCTLGSMTFFAAEMLKQAQTSSSSLQRLEENALILTKVSDALAWLKPNGEVEIIHDKNGLIAMRGHGSRMPYEKLKSSTLKSTIQAAIIGQTAPFTIRCGENVAEGQIHRLPDKSHLLHLQLQSQTKRPLNDKREILLWRKLAERSLRNPAASESLSQLLPADAQTIIDDIGSILLETANESVSVQSILQLFGRIFPRIEIACSAPRLTTAGLCPTIASSLLLLALSVRLRQAATKSSLRLTLSVESHRMLLIQFDCEGWAGSHSDVADSLETTATSGFRQMNHSLELLTAAFGVRWQLRCPILSAPKSVIPPLTKASPKEPSSVIQTGINVLQAISDPVNQCLDATNGRTTETSSKR